MGCNSEYMNQSAKERELQHTAKLLVYVLGRLGKEPEPWQVSAAKDSYCTEEKVVPSLCKLLAELDDATRDAIVYERTAPGRQLADWWEKHQVADRGREHRETRDAMVKLALSNMAASGLTNPQFLPLVDAYIDHIIAFPDSPHPMDEVVEKLKASGVANQIGLNDFYMQVWLSATKPDHERIWSLNASDIVGAYDEPDAVPALRWLAEHAGFAHRDNGSHGVWEYILNTSLDTASMPVPLKGVCLLARASGIAYVLFHQGS